eukprot:9132540-Pyramimonas_sp.AAC.1
MCEGGARTCHGLAKAVQDVDHHVNDGGRRSHIGQGSPAQRVFRQDHARRRTSKSSASSA